MQSYAATLPTISKAVPFLPAREPRSRVMVDTRGQIRSALALPEPEMKASARRELMLGYLSDLQGLNRSFDVNTDPWISN